MPFKPENSIADRIAKDIMNQQVNTRPSGSRAYPDAEQRYAAVTGAGYDLGKQKKSREGDIGRTSMKDFRTGGSTTPAQRASSIRGAGYKLSTGRQGNIGRTSMDDFTPSSIKQSSAPHPKPFGAMTGYMSMNQPVKKRRK